MIDLDAIKARFNAITPGDWYQGMYPDGDPIDGPTGEHSPGDNILCEGEEIARAECTIDAAFIAHAPTDIAALVEEVERLRQEAQTSSAILTEIAEDIRRELWLNEQDFRGHQFYDRIMDALPV